MTSSIDTIIWTYVRETPLPEGDDSGSSGESGSSFDDFGDFHAKLRETGIEDDPTTPQDESEPEPFEFEWDGCEV